MTDATETAVRAYGRLIKNALATIGLFVALGMGLKAADDLLFFYTEIGADETDGHGSRSGIALRTDNGTGCQYLESRFGGLTPRLDRAGKQICR